MVSVIIPIYGVEDYIEECLASLAAQTYTGPVECILVDDCSPDSSMQRVARFLDAYSGPIRFRTVRRERNGGLSAARNTGTDLARGSWIWFVDSDDTLPPDALRTLMAAATSAPDVSAVFATYTCFGDATGSPVGRLDGSVEIVRGSKDVRRSVLNHPVTTVTAWSRIVRRDALADLRFRPGMLVEDEEWHFRLVRSLSCVAICRASVYNYRIRKGSIMGDNTRFNARTRDMLVTMLRMERLVDGEARDAQLFWIHAHLIDLDTHLRWHNSDSRPSRIRHLQAIRLLLRRMRPRISPLHSPALWLSVALMQAELRSGITMSHPLFRPIHRAAKMCWKLCKNRC